MSDFLLSSYDYFLPEEQIAQNPAEKRDGSRLFVYSKNADKITHSYFKELIKHLPKNALLVANNSKVIPARILGNKVTGGALEFLLLSPPPLLEIRKENNRNYAKAEGLLKPSKGIKVGDVLSFGEKDLQMKILEKGEFGQHTVELCWEGSLLGILDRIGSLPLPPYINRKSQAVMVTDKDRYQTTHANPEKSASLAAPTAGLHFTPELREELIKNVFDWTELTLHVGYETFSPVQTENILEHKMHGEYVEISQDCFNKITKAKKEGSENEC